MEKKIYNRLRAHKRVKRGSTRAGTTDNTFDKEVALDQLRDFTLEEIRQMLSENNIAEEFLGIVGQGKEANVYWIRNFLGDHQAIKFFRIHTTTHNFNSLHARSKLSDTAKLGIANNLCLTEYLNLHYCYDAGVRVPKPGERYEFAYTMELIGDENGPAPLLRDVNLARMPGGKSFVIETLDDILDQMDLMFNTAEMVHGDFSEHNIVMYNYKPYIIDFLQSKRWHPNYNTPERIRKRDALKILKKDIDAILDHFIKKYRLGYDTDTVFDVIAGEVEDWSADELLSEYADPDAIAEEMKKM